MIIGIAVLVMLFISISRIKLAMHTPEEVFFGSRMGGLGMAAFSAGAKHLDKLHFHLRIPLLFVVATECIALDGGKSVQYRVSDRATGH